MKSITLIQATPEDLARAAAEEVMRVYKDVDTKRDGYIVSCEFIRANFKRGKWWIDERIKRGELIPVNPVKTNNAKTRYFRLPDVERLITSEKIKQ